jgi:cytochrome c553
MRTRSKSLTAIVAAILAGAFASGAATAAANDTTASNAAITAAEAWAFPVFPPPPDPHAPKPDPDSALHVTGSKVTYTQAALSHTSPDWFPQDHAPVPHVVAVGRKPASACAECHGINGAGAPATAILDSLPKAYIRAQLAAFRAGERGMGGPATTHDMVDEARALKPHDEQQAIDYFAATPFVPRVDVVETATVPKTHWQYFVRVPDTNGTREPIGNRIIETPVNFDDYAHADDHVRYIAYVPPGSIARGASIATHGAGSAAACESCHGAGLEGATMPGIGVVPPLAGRSPTYIARQLILFRLGRRTDPAAAPMRAEAASLTMPEMVAVAAYAASLKPKPDPSRTDAQSRVAVHQHVVQ